MKSDLIYSYHHLWLDLFGVVMKGYQSSFYVI